MTASLNENNSTPGQRRLAAALVDVLGTYGDLSDKDRVEALRNAAELLNEGPWLLARIIHRRSEARAREKHRPV
jgi:hypothetical protein